MTHTETPAEMPTRYDAIATESKWYDRWEAAGLFSPSAESTQPTFTITIPPPNITGALHMGHALCYPLQDVIGRYQRLRGKNVLVLPGQDHAGIATQSVVDKKLRQQGSGAAQLGRDAFVEKVWEWRKESGDTILSQFRALGCAFDWSRTRFTLDEKYAEAVLRVFIDWFDRGLVFRGKRVINWDPKLKTSVSDIETERVLTKGQLYHVRYPFADGSGEIVIATTRPETMIADVAVAVHPSDPRYAGIVGKMLELPLFGRQIPVIADPYVEMDFGTGALKITPAHDANDYQVGIRHGLSMPLAFDEDCRVKEEGPYLGMDRKEARTAIVKDLEAAGFLVGTEDREIPLIISDRSKEIIEPLLSEQWFVDQPSLAKPVIAAVKAGEVAFHPARYEGIFLAWMENIREWCISRQLWWGHRIPIYYTESGKPIAALSWEDALAKAEGETIVRQDEDVLDTWFSSGLWPFATLGWPDETKDLKRFYPTDVLVTDRNIINLWVARMMMMGYDLTGQRPFRDVVIYATVLNENGQRMSKSLGTGVDPMGVIDTLGADVLRWTLLSQTGENQDLRYSEKKNEEGRNFANKIWNATRFVLMNVTTMPPVPTELEKVDEWLLSRLNGTIQEVSEAYDSFDLQRACQALVRFFWYEICDWYIEVAKPRLQNESLRAVPQWCLLTVFDAFLKLLHPVMPFLTEELYGYLPLPNKSDFLMAAPWPQAGTNYAESEAMVGRAFEVTRAMRSLRAGLDLAAMKPIPRAYFVGDLAGVEEIVRTQAWTEELVAGVPTEKSVSTTIAGVDLYIPVDGLIDVDKQRGRLAKEEENLAAELKKLTDRLSNPQFTERAKPEVIERDRAAVADLEDRLEKNRERQRLFA